MSSTHATALPSSERLAEWIARYDRPGPRYTSYPTAPIWTKSFGPAQYAAELKQVQGPVSLYLHVPFCEALCTYCACNRAITRDHSVSEPYLDALEREVDLLFTALGGSRESVQLAIGGGTPTFLSELELARAIDAIDARFPPVSGAERSIELDPRVTTRAHMETLAARGFERVSLGVQDVEPRVQQAIRRIQPLEQTARLSETARELGVRSVNFDLIYGLPFQTLDSMQRTLDAVIALRPDRIALYGYAHVTWVSSQQRGFEREDLPDARRKLELLLCAIERLRCAGYLHLGLDHFALPHDALARATESGELQRNFMGYSVRAASELIALGPSGISELTRAYAQSRRTPRDWMDAIAAGELPTTRGHRLDDDDVRRRWLIQQLMCRGEIDERSYTRRFGESLEQRVPGITGTLADFVSDGLLDRDGERWCATAPGRLFLRTIAMVFDAHLTPANPTQPRYSRTV